MKYRKIVSLSIALSFLILAITGILSFFTDYSRVTASLHTSFGFLFVLGAILHLSNNIKALKNYTQSRLFISVSLVIIFLFSSAYLQWKPIQNLMDWGARWKATSGKEIQAHQFDVYEMNLDGNTQISLDLLRSKHYWHPQIAIWIEDTLGNYHQTLFVTKATAKGLFFGGRSKENYKTFDENKSVQKGNYRRVNALPVWSHQRGVQYEDGAYILPSRNQPLADAITGATPIDNFVLHTSLDNLEQFVIKLEINVAFDDNEFYSEFDFPDDSIFHNGTGQLGQPSLIFEAEIDQKDGQSYYLMYPMGHGHHSAQNGKIDPDFSTLTTALKLVERIVVGVKSED